MVTGWVPQCAKYCVRQLWNDKDEKKETAYHETLNLAELKDHGCGKAELKVDWRRKVSIGR